MDWHPRDMFFYLLVETGGKQIDLWSKPEAVTQNFKQFVDSIHSVLSLKTLDILSANMFSTPGMWFEEI